jgi:hypothetical protein
MSTSVKSGAKTDEHTHRVDSRGRAGDTSRDPQVGGCRDRAYDGPDKGTFALTVGPGVVVIGDKNGSNAGVLRLAGRVEEKARAVFFTG